MREEVREEVMKITYIKNTKSAEASGTSAFHIAKNRTLNDVSRKKS